jgi:mannosyltransferase OCH1-like enzyme/Flp pilus assembly protein TadD
MRWSLPASARYFSAALALAPRVSDVRLEYATTVRAQRRLDEAESVYQALLAEQPGVWQAMAGLGQCARARNDRAQALRHFRAATELAPEAEEPWFEFAAECRALGRFEDARSALRPLLDRPSAAARAWLGLGYVERVAGDRAAALAIFRDGSARYPRQHQFMIEIALEHRALGEFAEAEGWLRQAAELEDVASAALVHLGNMERAAERREEALDLFRRAARRLDAPAPEVHASIAQTLADLGRFDEALASLDAAERQIGEWPELSLVRASLLRRAGFRCEALDAVRKAVASMPGNFALWYEWCEGERFSGDFPGIDRCLAAAPAAALHERALLETMRGLVAAQRWQMAAAAAAFRQAITLNPELAGAHQALGLVSLLQFDIPTAREHLEIAAEQRAPSQRRVGLSPRLSQTHIGNLFDEFVIDSEALAGLVEAQQAAPADRIEKLLPLVRSCPDHTPTAIALLVALRQAGRLDMPGPMVEGSRFPATIVQYWDESVPPEDVAALMQSWTACNPRHQYRRFDDAAARAYLAVLRRPHVLRAYLRAPEPAMKADLFRLAYLYAEGGCYSDADDRCLRPLDELLAAPAGFVAFQEEYGTIGNNFLAATPRHPVLGLALRQAAEAINRGDHDMIWLATGPGLMTRAVAQAVAASPGLLTGGQDCIRILDRNELECVVACHCAVRYKNSRRHWLRASFGQPTPPVRPEDVGGIRSAEADGADHGAAVPNASQP